MSTGPLRGALPKDRHRRAIGERLMKATLVVEAAYEALKRARNAVVSVLLEPMD
jgi:hypothetical protein